MPPIAGPLIPSTPLPVPTDPAEPAEPADEAQPPPAPADVPAPAGPALPPITPAMREAMRSIFGDGAQPADTTVVDIGTTRFSDGVKDAFGEIKAHFISPEIFGLARGVDLSRVKLDPMVMSSNRMTRFMSPTEFLDAALVDGGSPQLADIRNRLRGTPDLADFDSLIARGVGNTRTFDAKSLYDQTSKNAAARDQPRLSDITQDNIGDCYLLGTLGALAMQDPQAIKDAIRYNDQSNSFDVTIYVRSREGDQLIPLEVNVTQDDLRLMTRADARYEGGSTVDNNPYGAGPVWPTVMELAFWKANSQRGELDGGWGEEAIWALTGKPAETREPAGGMWSKIDAAQIQRALNEGRLVTLTTSRQETLESPDLVGRHLYTVVGTHEGPDGKPWLDLRNPWGENANGGAVSVPWSQLDGTFFTLSARDPEQARADAFPPLAPNGSVH